MKKESAYFQQFTTQQLETMLRLELDQPQQEDEAILLQILEVLKEREKDKGTLPDVQKAWERFQSQYNIPEMEGLELYDLEEAPTQEKEARKEKLVPIRAGGRVRKVFRTAIVVAVTVVTLFCTTVCAQAAGYNIYGLLATWTNNIFQFQVSETTPTPAQKQDCKEMQEEISAIGISEKLAPSWWPERFELYNTIHEKEEGVLDSLTFEYRSQENDTGFAVFIDVYHDVNLIKNAIFEKDGTPPEQYTSHGRTFFILSNLDTYTATWNDGKIGVTIAGQLSRDEIISIIDSIGG